ncbi:MAG TPA: DUF4386 family protein [Dehalococcoidia bacterium]|nr:DUF4386 family protein [Dehalococcoidia bacterium]
MDLSRRVASLAGIALILAAILTVLNVGLTGAAMSDGDPFEREEVEEFLTDVNDNEGLLIAAAAVGIANDGVFVIIIAAAFYILFRDRNPFLATIALAGIAVSAALALVLDISNILLTIIADDYVNGGAGGVPAGDPATLELGRYVGVITYALLNTLFTPAGTGFIALGLLLLGPQGLVNPPRWIGWVAIIAGASAWLAWLVLVADPFFVFFPIQLISTLVLLLSLGVWLLRHSDLQPAPMKA